MRKLLFLIFFSSPCGNASFAAEMPPLFLFVGEQRRLQISGISKYSSGSPSLRIASDPQDKSRILIKSLAAGRADLWVWKGDGKSEMRTVFMEEPAGPNAMKIPELLLRSLGGLQEAEVLLGVEKVFLRGQVSSRSEWERIGGIKQRFATLLEIEVVPSPTLLGELERDLRAQLQEPLRLETAHQRLWVRGWIADARQASRVEKSLRRIDPLLEWDVSQLPDSSPTAFFRVLLLELRRQDFEKVGFHLQSSSASDFGSAGSIQLKNFFSSPLLIDATSLEAKLDLLSHEGRAKILSKPELVVRIPGKAEFFAGGEIPIKNEGRFFAQTSWKRYGLELTLNTTHYGGDRVRLEIQTQWSQLGSVLEGEKLPRIQSNRLQTQVDAKFGQPLMLCGLIEERVKNESHGIQGLKDIPILGALFGSKEFQSETSELVAIIIPHQSPPPPPLEKVGLEDFPKGPVPPPRYDARGPDLRSAPNYPWNVFE